MLMKKCLTVFVFIYYLFWSCPACLPVLMSLISSYQSAHIMIESAVPTAHYKFPAVCHKPSMTNILDTIMATGYWDMLSFFQKYLPLMVMMCVCLEVNKTLSYLRCTFYLQIGEKKFLASGDSSKWVKSKRRREKRDWTMVITMASYALQHHLGWCTQSRLGQFYQKLIGNQFRGISRTF